MIFWSTRLVLLLLTLPLLISDWRQAVVVAFSPYADGLLNGEIRGALVLATLPVLGVLVLAVGLGIEVPFQCRRLLMAWLRARKRKAGRDESEKLIR